MAYRIAVIPGDKCGPEIMREGVKVLRQAQALGCGSYELTEFLRGAPPRRDARRTDDPGLRRHASGRRAGHALRLRVGPEAGREEAGHRRHQVECPEPLHFEPIHGSAPRHAGKNTINPLATILAGALMLEWLGEARGAALAGK